MHKLTIRYHIKPKIAVNGKNGASFYIDKKITTNFFVNGETTSRHNLSAMACSTDLYYMWNAVNPYWYGVSLDNVPITPNASYDDYPKDSSDERDRWWRGFVGGTNVTAVNSCKNLPNVNAMSWYIDKGDPRWDGNYPWFFTKDGGANI